MFRLVKLAAVIVTVTIAVTMTAMSGFSTPSPSRLGIGELATPAEIARWDIDIRPDGQGLPEARGDVQQGDQIFAELCASCHGDFAEGLGNYPALVGGEPKELKTDQRPEKTVGSFWPYATTLFDYIRRAMPFGDAQSLSADETYALVAFLLSMNDIIPEDSVLDAESLAAITMPNEDGFYFDPQPDVANFPCMRDCTAGLVEIVSFALILNVTPDGL
jgi:cytochrome c